MRSIENRFRRLGVGTTRGAATRLAREERQQRALELRERQQAFREERQQQTELEAQRRRNFQDSQRRNRETQAQSRRNFQDAQRRARETRRDLERQRRLQDTLVRDQQRAARGAIQLRSGFAGVASSIADASFAMQSFADIIGRSFRAVVDVSAEFERLRLGLIALQGSEIIADEQLARIRELADLPGITYSGGIRGVTGLVSAGASNTLAENLLREVSNAIAVSGGRADDVTESLRQFGQILSAGRFTQQDLRPILQRAPVLRRAFQQEFGTFISGEINNVIERQGITIEQALSNVLVRAEEGPRADPTTFTNSVERFRDTVDDLLRDIGGGLLPTLKDFVESLRNFINFLRSPTGRVVLGGVVGAGIGSGIGGSAGALAGGGLGGSGIFGQRITRSELQRRANVIAEDYVRRTGVLQARLRDGDITSPFDIAQIGRRVRRGYTLLDDINILQNEGYYTPSQEVADVQRIREAGGTAADVRGRQAGLGRRFGANIRTRFAASGGFGGLAAGPIGILAGAGIGFAAGAIIEGQVQNEIEEINSSVIRLADSFTRLAEVAPSIRTLRENVSALNEAFTELSDDPFNRELRQTTATRATTAITQYERTIANLREQFSAAGESLGQFNEQIERQERILGALRALPRGTSRGLGDVRDRTLGDLDIGLDPNNPAVTDEILERLNRGRVSSFIGPGDLEVLQLLNRSQTINELVTAAEERRDLALEQRQILTDQQRTLSDQLATELDVNQALVDRARLYAIPRPDLSAGVAPEFIERPDDLFDAFRQRAPGARQERREAEDQRFREFIGRERTGPGSVGRTLSATTDDFFTRVEQSANNARRAINNALDAYREGEQAFAVTDTARPGIPQEDPETFLRAIPRLTELFRDVDILARDIVTSITRSTITDENSFFNPSTVTEIRTRYTSLHETINNLRESFGEFIDEDSNEINTEIFNAQRYQELLQYTELLRETRSEISELTDSFTELGAARERDERRLQELEEQYREFGNLVSSLSSEDLALTETLGDTTVEEVLRGIRDEISEVTARLAALGSTSEEDQTRLRFLQGQFDQLSNSISLTNDELEAFRMTRMRTAEEAIRLEDSDFNQLLFGPTGQAPTRQQALEAFQTLPGPRDVEQEQRRLQQQLQQRVGNIGRSFYQQFGGDFILDAIGIGGRGQDRVNDAIEDLQTRLETAQEDVRQNQTLSYQQQLDELQTLNEQYERQKRELEERSERERQRAWRDWVKQQIIDIPLLIAEQTKLQLSARATNFILNSLGIGGSSDIGSIGAGAGSTAGLDLGRAGSALGSIVGPAAVIAAGFTIAEFFNTGLPGDFLGGIVNTASGESRLVNETSQRMNNVNSEFNNLSGPTYIGKVEIGGKEVQEIEFVRADLQSTGRLPNLP